MRVNQQKLKKVGPVHPQVTELINQLLQTSKDDLPAALGAIDAWTWPRSDLNAWVQVLNKFDEILEDIIREYEIDKVQSKELASIDQELLCSVLRFERLLLENTTNRKSFNSYDRINVLLSVSDLDVLTFALNLLLRPAQQYSAQPSVAHALSISTSRLQALAKRWTFSRDDDVSLVDLTSANSAVQFDTLPPEAREVHFSFYRKGQPVAEAPKAPEEPSVFQTPVRKPSAAGSSVPAPASNGGAVQIDIPSSVLEAKLPMAVFADAVQEHDVPDAERFELLWRIRLASARVPGRGADRVKLAVVRLLAIAIFCHTHTDAQANSALFLFEPDLVAHIAEVLQLDRGVPVAVQTAGLAALDAIARYKPRFPEVLAAVSAGVTHGVLMALLRHTITEIASPDSTTPHAFVEALLQFVTFLASHGSGGSMIVAAGIVPLLIQLLENRVPSRLAVVTRTLSLVDIVLYGYANALQIFMTGHGVDVLVGRVEYEIDFNIAEGGDPSRPQDVALSYGHLSVPRASILKHAMRSMHRMMQASGNAEGLRGLIDSSLLKSLKKVMEQRTLFGPSVLAIATNMMATFVHNEPTSLPVIQEAGLPQAFYRAIEAGLEPMIEVIQAVPNALGALCLNQEGLRQLSTRPTIIPGLMSIFTSPRHIKLLADKENAVLVGTAIDELIRHHPTLKTTVLDSIKSILSRIEDMGNAFVPSPEDKQWYSLLPSEESPDAATLSATSDVTMEEDTLVAPAPAVGTGIATPAGNEQSAEEISSIHTNDVVAFIDVFGRFLEGFFQHHLHCDDFVKKIDGLDRLERITALSCLPYDFANSPSSDSLVQVARTLAEANPKETLLFLSRMVQKSLAETSDFWSTVGGGSKLGPLLEFADDEEEAVNRRFRLLVTLETRVTLLSEVYATGGYTTGRTAFTILESLLGPQSPKIVPDLGALHRACTWEHIVFKAHLAHTGVEPHPLQAPTGAPDADIISADASPTVMAENVLATGALPIIRPPAPSVFDRSSAPKKNAQALRHVVTQMPAALSPLFQAAVKLFTVPPRRNTDTAYKQLVADSAPVLAEVMLQHLSKTTDENELTLAGFLTIVLGLVAVLLIEDRDGSSQVLHAILVNAFYQKDGIPALLAIGQRFKASIEEIGGVAADQRSEQQKAQLVCSYAGVKVLLHLLQPLVSAKLLFESPQISALVVPGKKEGDEGYFSPHNLLVRLRTAILPFMRELWESPWLLEAPVGVIKSVTHIVLEIVKGENEESNGQPGISLSQTMAMIAPQPVQPDENRIQQITDMGFSRSAARRALTRARNNVATATELLLSQPYLFPPEADAPEDQDMDAAPPAPAAEAPAASSTTVAPEPTDPLTSSAPPTKTAEQWLNELKEARQPLQDGMGQFSLRLVDAHPGLIFDVQSVFVGGRGSYQEKSIHRLIEDVKVFSPAAYDVQEQPMAVRCRLLALTLTNPPSQDLLRGEAKNLMDVLLALLLSSPGQGDPDPPPPPKWLAAQLLVVEELLMMGEQPRAVTLPAEGEAPPEAQDIREGPMYQDARNILFETCMRLISGPAPPPPTDLLSSLRMLILLTREHSFAIELVKRDGVAALLKCLKLADRDTEIAVKSHVMVVLRHVVEDPKTLRNIMQVALRRFFSNPKTRSVELSTFVKSCSSVALRDPPAFVESTASTCVLTPAFGNHQHVEMKSAGGSASEGIAGIVPTNASSAAMQVDIGTSSASPQALDALVHALVKELMEVTKPAQEPLPGAVPDLSTQGTDAAAVVASEGSAAPKPGSHDVDQAYACFIMQVLTELLFSYDSCKLAFLSYSDRKRNQTPSKESAMRSRSTALQYVLGELVKLSSIEHAGDSLKHNIMCSWGMSVIVALCVDTAYVQDMKDLSPDVVSVRKAVLDAVSRALRELPSGGDVESGYGRLMALGDLTYRLLTVRPHSPSKKPPEDTPTHIAKLMIERNFVPNFTNALADVDLHYPNVRNVVTAVLKPLELLSRIAIKMGRTSDRSKDPFVTQEREQASQSEEEESEEETGDEEDVPEEAPDLYRNSALGMFSGEMEDVNFAAQDDIDEEEMDGDDDVEMDFADETDSEDSSHTQDDEDDVDIGDVEDAGENWQDEQADDSVLMENDDEGSDDGGDDQGEDDDEGDDDDDDEDAQVEEAMWQGPGIPDVEGDNEDVDAPVDEEAPQGPEDVDVLSDAEEYEEEDQGVELDDPQALDEEAFEIVGDVPHMIASFHGGGVLRAARRSVGGAFGAPSAASGTAQDAMAHPLLTDAAQSNGAGTSNQSRSRRTPRADGLSTIHQEVLNTIEDTLGHAAVQVFQRLMVSRQAPGGAALPADLLGGLAGRPRVSASRGQSRGNESRSAGRGFEPVMTSHRWEIEARMLHGRSALERLLRLQNHAALAMLPASIAAAEAAAKREAEAREDEERREKEAQEAARVAEEVAAASRTAEAPVADPANTTAATTEDNTQTPVVAQTPTASDEPMAPVPAPVPSTTTDAEMIDADASEPATSAEVQPAEPDAGSSAAAEQVTAEQAPAEQAPAEQTRIMVMIHGSPVDITDTGVDPTFLEALPDDMREEVLAQHIRDQRAARVERPAESQISTEFLDALPPEIRAEIIQQENMERASRAPPPAAPAVAGGAPQVAQEMDPASFIASLDPALRQVVLLDQDEGFIRSLPSHMAAEANLLRGSIRSPPGSSASAVRPAAAPKAATPREAIQLLDKSSVASLARLLFFPQALKKSILLKALVNLCENARTREELLMLLTNILQDGTGDVVAIDKSFAQLSVRNPKTPTPQTPKSVGKQRASVDSLSALGLSHQEAIPELIAQRCLEALSFIVGANEQSAVFYLTEHEIPASRRVASKKGKGKEKEKEKPTSPMHYPIVSLLSLLDRRALLKTPSIVEAVVGLLAVVTRPLSSLTAQPEEKPAEAPPTAVAPTDATAATTAPSAENATSAGSAAGSSAAQPPAATTDAAPPVQDAGTAPAEAAATSTDTEPKPLLTTPPLIPPAVLRLVVNVLTMGECSGRTFQQTLSLIQHLSCLPDSREVIALELREKAQESGQVIQEDLRELSAVLAGAQSDVLVSSAIAKFSLASSEQAKLLRVLKTIDYMYSPKTPEQAKDKEQDTAAVQTIYETFRFAPLWARLGDCLTVIEGKPELEHIATVLLPLIESLMVVCKHVGSTSTGSAQAILAGSGSPRSARTPRESMEDLFVTFTDVHRKVLNVMVRNNPSLMSGSFSLLVTNPRVLDFDNKRNYFGLQLRRRADARAHGGTLQLNLRRERVFEDSFQHLQRRTGEQIKHGKLSIRFYNEEGVDAGGLTREWFQILARQMFNADYALFEPCVGDKLTYQPNRASWVNPEHLSFFKFVGRVIGKAIYDGRLLDAYFARSFYRQLLGKSVDYRDVEWVDPEYYNSLCWILENDPEVLELTFSVEADEFGATRIIPLKEGGITTPVTNENKKEFVQLSAQYRLYSSIKDQIDALLAGFYDIIPKDLISIFNEQEVELLISGTPDIDVDEWRAATEYHGYNASDTAIVWWWRALKSFSREERAKVLSFATGTSRVPLGGFADLQGVHGVQKFSIHRAYGASDRLPQAHTCFNQIDLPEYTSYEKLRQQLLFAINEGGEGFGFA